MGSSEKVGIVGLGLNNRPLVPFLLREGHDVAVFDRRSQKAIEEELSRLDIAKPVTVYGGDGYLKELVRSDMSILYLTPGMHKHGPELEAMKARGVRLTCETELFLERCPAPVIGITGSAGKTTTTTLVGESLRHDGRRPVFVGGNIGHPLLPLLGTISEDSWVILELSSFQLDLVERSPHGAALLNLSPNHLDVHRDFDDYKHAKTNILRYQSKEDWAVLPFQDDTLAPLTQGHQGRQVFFSLSQEIAHGAYRRQGQLWWRGGNGARSVVRQDAMKLLGEHNVANALAAIAIVASAGGDLAATGEILENFSGVPHRLEIVREVGSVVYINDSIATAPDRTMAALKAISKPIVLILGGYDKKLDYDTLGQALQKSSVRTVVVLGEVRDKIERSIREHTGLEVLRADTFDEAVRRASAVAEPGDVVLLSPAAASYDMFTNFEERGQRFREIVGILNHNTSGLAE